MRGAASLGYLLARASDTLADSAAAPAEARLLCLDWFERAVAGDEPAPRWPLPVLNAVGDPRERRLLEAAGDLLAWLEILPEAEAVLVREVVGIIIGGQRLDLERFAGADPLHPAVLADEHELDDYTWRVAGCVGAFWTKLGFLTLGDAFSSSPPDKLLDKAIGYGKGLQLVNILRDLPADLKVGRCYVPVEDPLDAKLLMSTAVSWIVKARGLVGRGMEYAAALESRRLRAASGLPARIALETLDRLEASDWDQWCRGVKVPRSRVYRALAAAMFGGRSQ